MPKQARHIYTRSKELLRGIPGPIHHLTTHGIYANALGLFLYCLSVLCHEDRGGRARAMRDAGYAHRRGEGARSDQQPPAANHCQPAQRAMWK